MKKPVQKAQMLLPTAGAGDSESVRPWSRRRFVTLCLAAATGTVPAPAVIGAAKRKVVVVGGGPAGVTVARLLAAGFDGLEVSLVETNPRYVTPFFANRYIAGLAPIERFTHDYRKSAEIPRLRVVHRRATAIDAERRAVRLQDGDVLNYDRAVIAPGVELIAEAIRGYSLGAEQTLPHAYADTMADQWRRLRAQLKDMEDGGLVAVTVPRRPYRCEPAPYERASLIASYLKRRKPRSKLLILDANDTFPLMDVMLDAWGRLFGASIEWVPESFGGAVVAVDAKARTLSTVDDRFAPAVANVIPPQRAGRLAQKAGLADDSGWCPVDAGNFESVHRPGIHVLGDAIDAGDMPKSAFAAHSQARVTAMRVGNALTGAQRQIPTLSNACYFLLRKGSGLVVGGRYRVENGRINGIEGYASRPGEGESTRADTAAAAERWYDDLVHEMFG